MEDFQKLFYEEAHDFLSKLEEILLSLEDDPDNTEYINEVFRIMHSLKGSGAMFGYKNMSGFTHELESLYDQIRSNNTKLSSDIINFTIDSVDHIKEMLDNKNSPELEIKTSQKIAQLGNLFQNKNTEKSIAPKQPTAKKETDNKKPISTNKVYYIKFEPNEGIFNDGTNPLYLIDELVDLGDSVIFMNSDNIPGFEEINPENCYLSWVIILSTKVDLSIISDVFIFVEDDSNIIIEILSEKDLFSIANAITTFEYIIKNKSDDLDSFKNISRTLENSMGSDKNISPVEEIVLLNKEIEKQEVIESEISFNDNTETVNIEDHNIIAAKLNIETVKVSAKKLDSLINMVSEFVTTQARLVTIANDSDSIELTSLSEDFQHLSRQFRDIAFDMRLIPIQTMLVKFKRLVRDLSRNLNKKVEFITEGTETELDKSIIATLSDPVMHIIRNAIDHGIETPKVRINNNKPEIGTISLKAQYSGTSIIISINDDGAGINTDKVLQKAIDKNLIQLTDELTKDEIFNLIMLPGFSTSETVSDVSGRGVGMDIVRKNINELRGEVSINSELGKGTSITIRLPLTLSIIDGLLVSINHGRFVIPLAAVQQIYKVNEKDIDSSYNNIIDIEGVQFPFINLTKEFENSGYSQQNFHLVTVTYHDKDVGIIVNELISEYQAVLKPIDNLLQSNEIFAGASILGDGKVALILDTNKLIDFYTNNK